MVTLMKIKTLAVSLSMLFVLGCTELNEEQLIQKVEQRYANGNIEAGIIEAKQGIVTFPDSWRLRVILADAYVAKGNIEPASKELTKSLELAGAEQKNNILLKLLPLHYLLERNEETLSLTVDYESAQQDIVTFYRAVALYRIKDHSEAKRVFSLIKSNDEYFQTARAHIAIMDENIDEAEQLLTNAIAKSPNFYVANVLMAELNYLNRELLKSKNILAKLVQMPARSILVDLMYASVLIDLRDFEAGEEITNRLFAAYPESSELAELKAKIEFQREEYVLAKSFAEKSLDRTYSSDDVLYILGVSNFKLKYYEQAIPSLTSGSANSEFYQTSQTLLFTIKLLLNSASNLEESPEELIEKLNAVYLLAQNGELSTLQLLTDVDVSNVDQNTLAQILLLKTKVGDLAAAEQLKNIALAQASSPSIKAIYLDSLNSLEKYDELISYAITFAQQGSNVDYIELALNTLYVNQQSEKVIALFQLATAEFPNDITIKQNYLKFLYDSEDYVEAIKVISDLKKIDPTNSVLLATLANMYSKDKNENALEHLQAVYVNDMDNLQIATFYASTQAYEPAKVEAVLSRFLTRPTIKSEAFWQLLFTAQLQQGKLVVAAKSSELWVTSFNSFTAWQSLVTVLDVAKQYNQALVALVRMEALFGDSDYLNILKAHYYLSIGKVLQAEQQWKDISLTSRDTVGYLSLQARLSLQSQEFEKTLEVLEMMERHTEFRGFNPREVGVKTAALLGGGNKQEAIIYLEEVLPTAADKNKIRFLLIDLYTDMDPEKALYHISLLPEPFQNQANVINNKSMLYLKIGNLEEADNLAEQLKSIEFKNDANLLHSIGLIKCRIGEFEEGREALLAAIEISSIEQY